MRFELPDPSAPRAYAFGWVALLLLWLYGSLATLGQAAQAPLILAGAVLLALTAWQGTGRGEHVVFALAVLTRLLFAVFTLVHPLPAKWFADMTASGYIAQGWADLFTGQPMSAVVSAQWHNVGYPEYLLGLALYGWRLLGGVATSLGALGALVSAALVYPLLRFAQATGLPRAWQLASAAAWALWPSAAFLSLILDRDPYVDFCLTWTAATWVSWARLTPRQRALPLAVSAAVFALGRPYLLAFVPVTLLLAWAIEQPKRLAYVVPAAVAAAVALHLPERLAAIHDHILVQTKVVGLASTTLYWNLHYAGWSDFLRRLPGQALYVFSMPLPGAYPLHNLGLKAAALENLGLLAIAAFGVFACVITMAEGRALDTTRVRAARYALLFFALCVSAYGVVEPDLGAAIRHKPEFVTLLFPWAALAARGLRLKVRRKHV